MELDPFTVYWWSMCCGDDKRDIDCFVMFRNACHIECRVEQQFKQKIGWYDI